MIRMIIEFTIVILGMASTFILYFRFPALPSIQENILKYPSISVIIPARNEEKNIALLLKDLKTQTIALHKIICVNDLSEDKTSQIAAKYGARVINIKNKPNGWIGKSWAAQNGANIATGELLLFLDADVRVKKDGIKILVQAYLKEDCTVSVQPYHKTNKMYEQFSMFFNLIQISANGIALPKPKNTGLYGPVILIPKSDYLKIGGHERVRQSIVEDMALGAELKKANIPFSLFIGNQNIYFRMYSDGFLALLQGWTKNISSGATRTPLIVFIMVFLWISSLISVPVQIVKFAILQNWPLLITCSALYIIWVLILIFLSKRVGNFKVYSIIFYPILMFVTLCVCIVSMFKKIFNIKVKWKGRTIDMGKKHEK